MRIDAVHYCALEDELAEKRKHRSFFDRNADSRDPPRQRLTLFARTVRQKEHLARLVEYLKLAYMTREASKLDLTRTVSVLPNLRYVDLPEGFFSDDASSAMLRHELQGRCPQIRKMRYMAGSESSFVSLATRMPWRSIEVLELTCLHVDPAMLVRVLVTLPYLYELTLSSLPWLDDTVFEHIPSLPPFPALQKLSLRHTPRVTAVGLVTYLSRPEVRHVLASLSLEDTGVMPWALHAILARADQLTHFSIIETVSRPFPTNNAATMAAYAAISPVSSSFPASAMSHNHADPVTMAQPPPPLASRALVALHYEITDTPSSAHSMQPPSTGYYDYLAQSLHANALPSLRALYVRDVDFPEKLILLEPPRPAFSHQDAVSDHTAPARPTGFNQQLAVYSKGVDQAEWVFTSVAPPPLAHGRRDSFSRQRPASSHRNSSSAFLDVPNANQGGGGGLPSSFAADRLSLPPGWSSGGEARRSILVGTGYGGFLAVPDAEDGTAASTSDARASSSLSRPGSSGSWAGSASGWSHHAGGVGGGGGGSGGGGGGGSSSSAGGSSRGHVKRGSRHDIWR